MKKTNWINLLKEYLEVINANQNHYCSDSQIGFDVKCYNYPSSDRLIDGYKEKYKDNEEVVKYLDRFVDSLDKYPSLFTQYQDDAWDHAREYFIDMCAIDSKGYVLKNYKHYPLIKTKKMALKVEKENDLKRRAFSKLKDLFSEGRMGGYAIFDYDFVARPEVVANAIYDLEHGITLVEFDDYYGFSAKEIREDIADLKLIREEVKSFRKGHMDGWLEEVTCKVEEGLIEYIPSGRKALTDMLHNLNGVENLSSKLTDSQWRDIDSMFSVDIRQNIKECINVIEDLLKSEYSNENVEI